MSASLGLNDSCTEVQLLTHDNNYDLGRNVGQTS